MIETSGLDAGVKERSSVLFRRLGEVEASIHGIDVDDVTFHEVGAVDSIVDVVGSVIGLGWLDVDRFLASPLNVGSGTVKIAHGVYPVPPPATLQLVSGVPVYGKGRGELLTPTGALWSRRTPPGTVRSRPSVPKASVTERGRRTRRDGPTSCVSSWGTRSRAMAKATA